ncbi:hypothetical protein LCGC14_1775040 [marine sediment metagenome]|uniref:Uncharacterized protein n=1 Tax=marine sediment metagenome TaxID=412755 RepID=A0A0F9JWU6_9ZZZZ
MDFEVFIKPESQKRAKRKDRALLGTEDDKITIANENVIREIYYKDIENVERAGRYPIIVKLRNEEGFTIIPTVPHKHYPRTLASSIGDLRRQTASFKRLHILYNILLSKLK